MSQEIAFSKLTNGILVASSIGAILSVYSLYVEQNAESDDDYEAMCDISEQVSCSKVLTSEYGKGFGLVEVFLGEDSIFNIPNGIYGLIFYALIGGLSFSRCIKVSKAQVILSALSNLMSLYLAYILVFILEDVCVVCITTYAINVINLLLSAQRYNILKEQKIEEQFRNKLRDNNDTKID